MEIHEPSEQPSTRWVTFVLYNSLDHQYALATNRLEEIKAERDQLRQQLAAVQAENERLKGRVI